jgi:hypothetical protein
MEVEWHPIKTKKDLPRRMKYVLVTIRGYVDVSFWDSLVGEVFWDCGGAPMAWAELPKPYKKPKK